MKLERLSRNTNKSRQFQKLLVDFEDFKKSYETREFFSYDSIENKSVGTYQQSIEHI